MKNGKRVKVTQRVKRLKKKGGARLQLRKMGVREIKSKIKSKVRERSKKENNGEAKQILREVDLRQEKTTRTGFRVPPLYKYYIKLLGKKMRTSDWYGSDLSESAVVIQLVSEKCRQLKIFS